MKQATTKYSVSEIFLMQNDIGSLYMQFVLLSIIFYRAFLVSKIRKSVSMKKLYFHVMFFTTVPRHDTSIARWKKSRRVTKWSGYLINTIRVISAHTSYHHPWLDQSCRIHTWLQWNIEFHKSLLYLLSVCWSRDLGESCLQLTF